MRINKLNSNISFQGNYSGGVRKFLGEAKNKILNYDTLDFKAKNINFPMYAAMLMGVVIGSRYFLARDNDEKREILTRDVIGLSTYLFAMPVFMRGVSHFIEKKTGFLTMFKKKVNDINDKKEPAVKSENLFQKIKGYLFKNEGHQLLTFNDIKNTYVNNEKMSDFAELITKNTSEDGNHLHRILSYALGGKDNMKELANKTENKDIVQWLKDTEKAGGNALFEKIREQFTENGRVHKRAETLKAVPDLMALGITVTLLGFILPWFNIQHTRKLYKTKQQQNDGIKMNVLGNGSYKKSKEISMNDKFRQFQLGLL